MQKLLHIGNIFGLQFWQYRCLLKSCLIDSNCVVVRCLQAKIRDLEWYLLRLLFQDYKKSSLEV